MNKLYTQPEYALLKAISKNIKFFTSKKIETQYKVGEYYIDIAFVDVKLAIEVMGSIWNSTPESNSLEMLRDKSLEKDGWKVWRFLDTQIDENVAKVVDEIQREVNWLSLCSEYQSL